MPNGLGRRILLSGSGSADCPVASLEYAHAFVRLLVPQLAARGATFVVPIDAEPHRTDRPDLALTFDWSVLEAAWLARPERHRPHEPYIVAVSHSKGLASVPAARRPLWADIRVDGETRLVSLGELNLGALRREAQARHAHVMLALGGSEGVLHLADLLHDQGRPVVPLNLDLGWANSGAQLLARSAPTHPRDFFRLASGNEGGFLDSVDLSRIEDCEKAVSATLALVDGLTPPRAFAVRLLNPTVESAGRVTRFFEEIVEPVALEVGYEVVTVGRRESEAPFLNQEIFDSLHRSDIVIADLTDQRPNCYLELGYSLGRQIPTLVTAEYGTAVAFDAQALATHYWSTAEDVEPARARFGEYWERNAHRPPLVDRRSLVR